MKTKGVIAYEGKSRVDGKPIVVIGTGFSGSSNPKTGSMIQWWILRSDIAPHLALKQGKDVSICGDCPLRGVNGKKRACYVTVHQAPLSVYKAYKRGNYSDLTQDTAELSLISKNRMHRLGAYGDPYAVPVEIWDIICESGRGNTGYTHQWHRSDAKPYMKWCMASADTTDKAVLAQKRGYRTFRVRLEGEPLLQSESVCPNESIGLTCIECKSCNGGTRNGSIAITVHGTGSKSFNLARVA